MSQTGTEIRARLDEFRALKDGWLEGHGMAPRHEDLDWLATQFEHHYPAGLPAPRLYPTEQGGVQAEWRIGPNDISLEFDLASKQGEWHHLNDETDLEESQTLNLGSEAGWQWLARRIAELAETGT